MSKKLQPVEKLWIDRMLKLIPSTCSTHVSDDTIDDVFVQDKFCGREHCLPRREGWGTPIDIVYGRSLVRRHGIKKIVEKSDIVEILVD